MVHTNRIREFEFLPMNRRVSSSKYWTRCLASSTSLPAASRAIPTNVPAGSSSKSIIARLYIRLFFAYLSRKNTCRIRDTSCRFVGFTTAGFHSKLGYEPGSSHHVQFRDVAKDSRSPCYPVGSGG